MKRQPKPIDPVMEILLHSLGLRAPFYDYGTAYRDHYVCVDGSPLLERMVAARLMVKGVTMNGVCGDRDRVYHVSPGGSAVAKAFVRSLPRQTRDQKRYARWLRVSDVRPDLRFGDWLRLPKAERGGV